MATVTIKPRLQVERYSLYWKEPLSTETKCLPTLKLDNVSTTRTIASIFAEATGKLGWQPVEELQRLDGFNDDWERAISHGRQLDLTKTLDEQQLLLAPKGAPTSEGITITYVRKALKADGWKIRLADDFMSDSEDDE